MSEGIKSGKNVFVHCYHGISRSACLVIVYLIAEYNFTYQEALEITQKCRGIVNPNLYYLMLLEEFHQKHTQNKSIIQNEVNNIDN